jgi:tetratricopeptide (TPR) repeat protein
MDSREVVARFEAERQALALMDHPSIATVLDAGTTDQGRPYFVMELVRGLPITDYCDRDRLPADRRLRLFARLCRAVQHAHQKGVIHRDLKPSNVLVALHDGEPVPKVIDFGVAKAINQRLTENSVDTRVAQLVGTPMYMSPEQAELSGLDVDTRADVYSLGVLLYELLTGTTPFDEDTLRRAGFDEMRRMIREDEPPRPSERVSTLEAAARTTVTISRGLDERRLSRLLRGDLDWVVMKALEKDRDRRYESAGDFAADVERYLAGRPVEARPPSAVYRMRKLAQRNKAAVATTAVLLVAVLAVAGTVGWFARARWAERAETEGRAGEMLENAVRFEQAGRWGDALASVERAEAALGPTGDAELRDRVRDRKRDLALVLRAAAIRLEMSTIRDMEVDADRGNRLFADAFREYGLDADALPPAEAAGRLPGGAVRVEVVAALDDWARVRRQLLETGNPSWRHLLAIARAADPDPWRDRVRALWQDSPLYHRPAAAESLEEWRKRLLTTGWDRGAFLSALRATLETAPLETTQPGITLYLVEVANKHPAVLAMLREDQRRRPGDLWVNLALADQLAETDARDALPFIQAAVALQPESPVLLLNLGFALTECGKYDEAIAILERAIRMKPEYASAHINRGIALAGTGRPGEALAAYREAVRVRPDYWRGYHHLGRALYNQGQFREAVADLQESLRLRPGDVTTLINLGQALDKAGAGDEAIAKYREAIRLSPGSAEAYSALGKALEGYKRDLNGAIKASRKAVELSPRDPIFQLNLGDVLAHKGDLESAIAAYREAMRLNPNDALAPQGLATVLIRKEAWDEVVTVARESNRLHPTVVNFHEFLARGLAGQGKLDDAIATLRDAVRLQPNLYSPRHNLCTAFILRRSWADVIVSAREAIRLKPDSALDYYNLGQALREQGRYQESLAALRRADELGSRTPGWRVPSARWVKECEALVAAAEKHRIQAPTEMAPLPRPRN